MKKCKKCDYTSANDNNVFCVKCGSHMEEVLHTNYHIEKSSEMVTGTPKNKGLIALIIVMALLATTLGGIVVGINLRDNKKEESQTELLKKELSEINKENEELIKASKDNEQTKSFEYEQNLNKLYEDKMRQDEEQKKIVIEDQLIEEQERDYIFPHSNVRLINKTELQGLSDFELSIARNEMFARYGWVFEKQELKEYFSEKPWYVPGSNNNSIELNDIETKNTDLIKSFEPNNNMPVGDNVTGKYVVSVEGITPNNELIVTGFYVLQGYVENYKYQDNLIPYRLHLKVNGSKRMNIPLNSNFYYDSPNGRSIEEVFLTEKELLEENADFKPYVLSDLLEITLEKGKVTKVHLPFSP